MGHNQGGLHVCIAGLDIECIGFDDEEELLSEEKWITGSSGGSSEHIDEDCKFQDSTDKEIAVGNEVVIHCPKGQIEGKIISVLGGEAQLVVTQPLTSLCQTSASASGSA